MKKLKGRPGRVVHYPFAEEPTGVLTFSSTAIKFSYGDRRAVDWPTLLTVVESLGKLVPDEEILLSLQGRWMDNTTKPYSAEYRFTYAEGKGWSEEVIDHEESYRQRLE